MKNLVRLLILTMLSVHCYKEEITLGTNADDTFYIKHEDASMHVLVRGNTASKIFMIIVHGGPGTSGYVYNTPKLKEILQPDCAVVFYDQRNAGASQGNANSDNFTLPVYADDLKELIAVLKYRYGEDISLFLMAKSFGGMVAAQFLTDGNNQDLVKGWIFADASHNYGLNDSLTYQMLLDNGLQHIAAGENPTSWEPIVEYCLANPPGPFSFEQSFKLNELAWKAQRMIEGLEPYTYDIIQKTFLSEHIPLTNYWMGRTNAGKRKFNKTLLEIKFAEELQKVTVPLLVCFGTLDFVCPPGLGEDLMTHIGASDKEMLLFEKSAHRFEEQDAFYFAFRKFMLEHH